MKSFTFETPGRGKGEQICWGCAQARKTKARAAAMRAQGMALNGKPLDPDGVRQKVRVAERAREKNATPIGNLKSRLQNSLRRLKADRFHVSQNLGYGGQEMLSHVSERIAHYKEVCPICQVAPMSIQNLKSFEIEHRIPTSSARTQAEMLALFGLDNLDVACRKCNRWLKAQYMRDYWTTPGTIRNFADRDQLLDAQTLPEMVRLAEQLRIIASKSEPIAGAGDIMPTPAESGNAGRMYAHDGITQSLSDWAKQYGVPKNTIVWRLNAGVPFAEAIQPERPQYPTPRKKISVGNTGMTFEIATAIRRRIDEGATRKQVMAEFPSVSKYQLSDLLSNYTWTDETVWWTEREKVKRGPSRKSDTVLPPGL